MNIMGLIIIGFFAFCLQFVFTLMQIRNFTAVYKGLRKKGKVAIGRCKGRFRAGAIVMFSIDDAGIIQSAVKIQGVTAFAKFKPFQGFEGKYVGDLCEEDAARYNSMLRKAVLDASKTYQAYINGEEIPQPLSPFQKAEAAGKKLLTAK